MSKNLVIVESPAKAKTIEKYLGADFTVKSSFGHIRDLPKSGMALDIEGGTFQPEYEISDGKGKVVAELKKAVKESDVVYLAADPDREGEAIAWHLFETLGLKNKNTKRIVFSEITKSAVQKAVANPGEIDQHLVDAQQARRVLDRLVGYELSPVLWRKIQTGLSAGRVQSVAVRLIVEREREIQAFESTSSFKIIATFTADGKEFSSELEKKFENEKAAKQFLESISGENATVESLEQKPGSKNPSPPFTTSTLQQLASQRLGFSVKQTMQLAQRLYEAGKITYMRTDSVNLSGHAIANAKENITKMFGAEYSEVRQFTTKTKGAQEAHEAIRPTDFSVEFTGNDEQQKKLYRLIWQRAIASQMASAKVLKTTIMLSFPSTTPLFVATGEVVTFDGFLKVFGDQDKDTLLPILKKGDALAYDSVIAKETFTRPPARYSEASLVKALEDNGIGRPSTYAPTISTIQDRGYVMKGESEGEERISIQLELKNTTIKRSEKKEKTGSDKGRLLPTAIGTVVNDFLVLHFSQIVDYDFTKNVEEEFDEIAEGKKKWNAMIADFYTPFKATIGEKMENVERSAAIQERVLGNDPKTGKPLSVRVGRFGPYAQIGTKDDEEKPVFASLKPGQRWETITLEEAIELFKLPRLVGQTKDGQDIKANFGRFGPYIQVGKLFVSLGKKDPLDITLEEAIELYEAKLTAEKEKYMKNFPNSDVQILKGRWGPYLSDGEKNAKIPKTIEDPLTLSLTECEKILKEDGRPAKKGKGVKKATKAMEKKTSAKKAPAKKTLKKHR